MLKFLVKMLTGTWSNLREIKIAKFTKKRISGRGKNIKHGWSLEYYQIDKDELSKLGKSKGIYFICCSNKAFREAVYPVYVGITSETFFERVRKHTQKGGVFAKIYDEEWESGFCQDFTLYTKEMDITTAKFLESTFLAAFDFARNAEENDGRRSNLVKERRKTDGQGHFFKTLNTKFISLQKAIEELNTYSE